MLMKFANFIIYEFLHRGDNINEKCVCILFRILVGKNFNQLLLKMFFTLTITPK